MIKTTAILTPRFIAITTVNFCLVFGYYLSTVMSAGYAINALDSTHSIAGLSSGIFLIGTMFALILIGTILDEIDLKAWLFLSLLAYFATTVLYFMAVNVYILIALRLLHGFIFGLCTNICGLLAIRMMPDSRRGLGLGLYAESLCLASAMAPFVAMYFSGIRAYESGFLAMIVVSFIGLCVAIFSGFCKMDFRKMQNLNAKKILKSPNILSTLKILAPKTLRTLLYPPTFRICVITCIIAFCYSGILSFMGEFCEQLGLLTPATLKSLESSSSSPFFGSFFGSFFGVLHSSLLYFLASGLVFFPVYALISFLARPLFGRIFDCIGSLIFIPVILCFCSAFVLLFFTDSVFLLVLAAVFTGLGYGSFYSLAHAYALRISPPHKAGLASSNYFISLDFGIGVGPFFLGLIVSGFGYGGMFLVCAFVCAVALGLYFAMIKI